MDIQIKCALKGALLGSMMLALVFALLQLVDSYSKPVSFQLDALWPLLTVGIVGGAVLGWRFATKSPEEKEDLLAWIFGLSFPALVFSVLVERFSTSTSPNFFIGVATNLAIFALSYGCYLLYQRLTCTRRREK